MSGDFAATQAETAANRREIEKLRERSHEYGNSLQEQAVVLEGLDKKMDAFHESIKGRLAELKGDVKLDLADIKTETSKTNGRVTGLERSLAVVRGVGIAAVALTPFGVFVLQLATS